MGGVGLATGEGLVFVLAAGLALRLVGCLGTIGDLPRPWLWRSLARPCCLWLFSRLACCEDGDAC